MADNTICVSAPAVIEGRCSCRSCNVSNPEPRWKLPPLLPDISEYRCMQSYVYKNITPCCAPIPITTTTGVPKRTTPVSVTSPLTNQTDHGTITSSRSTPPDVLTALPSFTTPFDAGPPLLYLLSLLLILPVAVAIYLIWRYCQPKEKQDDDDADSSSNSQELTKPACDVSYANEKAEHTIPEPSIPATPDHSVRATQTNQSGNEDEGGNVGLGEESESIPWEEVVQMVDVPAGETTESDEDETGEEAQDESSWL